ncbi:ADP-ribosyl-(dinitrogen reductase) hydrolase [Azorhizophilus paspali]|uniref:ADP-ribosyl-(Dinitrogen reductase) hydrolase n=1 Tax=Azorhizophilus paspali TaxID=69963 RepID=A0ABV6SGQ4_AZOPA
MICIYKAGWGASLKGLIISDAIQEKLDRKHGGITRREIEQCFENCEGEHLVDTREEHRTDPPTKWFVAQTNTGRLLKVVFVFKDGSVYLKTAYEANPDEIRIYEKFALNG